MPEKATQAQDAQDHGKMVHETGTIWTNARDRASRSNAIEETVAPGLREAVESEKKEFGTLKTKAADYQQIIDYFKEKAKKDKKQSLFDFFAGLSYFQKVFAIRLMVGGQESQVNLANVKSNMKSGYLFWRGVNWDKFAAIARDASKRTIIDPTETRAIDIASATTSGAGASASTVGAIASISKGGEAVASGAAPVSSGIGAFGAAIQVATAYANYSESLDAVEKAQVIGGEAMSGMADIARSTGQAVETGQKMAGATVSAGATMAAGVGGVVGGAFYLATGIVGAKSAHDRAKALDKLEQKAKDDKDDNLAKTAELAKSTQNMNVTKNAGTALKGAMMIAGGAVLLALGSNPVGWILLGVAGIIGGAVALHKMWKKAARRTEVVDRCLNTDKRYEELVESRRDTANFKAKLPSKDDYRKTLLAERGFNNEAQCYNELLADLAEMTFQRGVVKKEPEYITLIESLGLKVDHKNQKPDAALIATKIHN